MRYDEILERISESPTGCWEWQGARLASGYGSVRFDGRAQVVHRVTWEHRRGPIAPGLQIDHLCRNRICCNPDHLEPVSQAENLRRGQGFSGVNARKTQCPLAHELFGDNLYVSPKGYRECRTCKRARRRAHYIAQRAA